MVLLLPHIGEHTFRIIGTGLTVVDIDTSAVCGSVGEFVIKLHQLVHETEGQILSVSILFGHHNIESCQRTHKAILCRKEFLGGEISIGSHIEPVFT